MTAKAKKIGNWIRWACKGKEGEEGEVDSEWGAMKWGESKCTCNCTLSLCVYVCVLVTCMNVYIYIVTFTVLWLWLWLWLSLKLLPYCVYTQNHSTHYQMNEYWSNSITIHSLTHTASEYTQKCTLYIHEWFTCCSEWIQAAVYCLCVCEFIFPFQSIRTKVAWNDFKWCPVNRAWNKHYWLAARRSRSYIVVYIIHI